MCASFYQHSFFMPLYAYHCTNCSKNHEALQKIIDPVLTICPHCHQSTLVRALTAPNFRLKGGGWYETDFKSDTDKKRNLADSQDKPIDKPVEKNTQKAKDTAPPATTQTSSSTQQKTTN